MLRLVSAVRESRSDSVQAYTQGGCYQFFLVLRAAFPGAVPYYDGVQGHVLTRIGGRLYDVTGEVRCPQAYPLSREPRIARQAHRWQYRSHA
ncbi:hypothetical protein AAT1_02007 [Pseudomonas phage AAT-1]|uniref:Uncharacterized protein n=1 Tax=Pseudomonas phage AAT-1 TaxID=1775248 RepID=A0A125SA33_9CAUD|nr:hypothetical protein P9A56_gp07 [Pseudomonas phage AAT-1]AME18029.1 hypothetical protein AAT1_02007 [Pseudomonas phage AAT-1]